MDRAIRLREIGGPDVLRVERSDPGRPGPKEVRLRQTAIGINFIDIVQRRGASPNCAVSASGLGGEAAGIIEAVGSEVRNFSVGDLVAYANVYGGAYANVSDPADVSSDRCDESTNAGVAKALLDEAAAKLPAATAAMPRTALRRESGSIIEVSESLIFRLQDWP